MIYKINATIPSSKIFIREYEVPAGMNLFEFNKYILNDLCFSTDQMVVYRAFDEKESMQAVYGLFDFGDGSMDQVSFEQIVSKGQKVIHFCYDLHNDSIIVLTIIGEDQESSRCHYPRTTLEKGHNPDQFAAKYEDPQTYIMGDSKSNPAFDKDFDDDDDADDDDEKDDDNVFNEFEDGTDEE